MNNRGAIRNRERYSQGYDHSEWQFLPNKITPSDIDVVFDFRLRARQMFCEFSCEASLWEHKPFGQRCLYEQLLRTNGYGNASVLCRHSVDASRDICTLSDVESFHVMRIDRGELAFFPDIKSPFDGRFWGDFVRAFYGIENKWGKWW